jgi:micrococcal nuclease
MFSFFRKHNSSLSPISIFNKYIFGYRYSSTPKTPEKEQYTPLKISNLQRYKPSTQMHSDIPSIAIPKKKSVKIKKVQPIFIPENIEENHAHTDNDFELGSDSDNGKLFTYYPFCEDLTNNNCVYPTCNETVDLSGYLQDITIKETVVFKPPITSGKVVKVYDGDTITIATKIPCPNSPIYRFSVRLNGIDSPEIRGKNEKEKELAIVSRDKLHALIFGKIVSIRNIGTEKYGRVLADVFLDELHVNQWMLDNFYAVEYNGKTKKIPDEWK